MKQELYFQSEDEFQTFFGQLCSAEIPDFQAIEGSGGDMGFDGLSDKIAYQVFYPIHKNRTIAKYKGKIDSDLTKVLESKKKLGLKIERWIFVVPEDLRIEVVSYLKHKSEEAEVRCEYWGYTKLSELVNKHPYIKDSFPTIFLPPVRKGLDDLKEVISKGNKPRVIDETVEIVSDKEYGERKQAIQLEYQRKAVSVIGRYGGSSGSVAGTVAFQLDANKRLSELRHKKERSDKAYQLELEEMNEYYNSEIEEKKTELNRRGILVSGICNREVGKIEVKRNRDIERLKLKYDKEESAP